jgi:hypothetical protein
MQNETANNHTPSKANSSTIDPNTCMDEELSNNECQEIIVKLINVFEAKV